MFSFEEAFIHKLQSGDDIAFGKLYNQTVDAFFRYAKWRYNIPDGELEDILATFYAKVWDSLPHWRGDASLENYLWTIYKNTLKDYFKKSKPHYFSQIDSSDAKEKREDTLESDDDILSLMETTVTFDTIKQAMSELDELSYEIIYHRFLEEKDYDQIADLYGVDSATIRQRVSRALKKLRQLLDGKGLW